MLTEQDRKLKEYLIFFGMRTGAYWLSWTLLSLISAAYISFSITSLSYMMQWDCILNLPFPILFIYFFLTSIGMNTLGFLLSSISTNSKTGYTISYSFLLISFVYQVFLTTPQSILMFYGEGDSFKIFRLMGTLFNYYIGFNYVKIWSDMMFIAGSHFDPLIKA